MLNRAEKLRIAENLKTAEFSNMRLFTKSFEPLCKELTKVGPAFVGIVEEQESIEVFFLQSFKSLFFHRNLIIIKERSCFPTLSFQQRVIIIPFKMRSFIVVQLDHHFYHAPLSRQQFPKFPRNPWWKMGHFSSETWGFFKSYSKKVSCYDFYGASQLISISWNSS